MEKMKEWNLENEKDYQKWSKLIKKYEKMGYDNDEAILHATKEMNNDRR